MSQDQGLEGPAPAGSWTAPDRSGADGSGGTSGPGPSWTAPSPGGAGGPPGPGGRWTSPDPGGTVSGGYGRVPVATDEPPDLRQRYDRIPLRPLGIGELLDGTFATIRRNPRATIGLAAVLVTVQQLLSVGVQLVTEGLPTRTAFEDGAFDFQAIGGFGGIVGTLLAAVVGAVLTGMIVVVVAEDVLDRRTTAGEVWRRIRPRTGALLVAATIAGILPYVGLILLVFPGLFLWAAWALTTPALVLEKIGPFKALGRSWQLAVPSVARVWWVRAVSVLLGLLMQLLIVVPFQVAGAVVAYASEPDGDVGATVATIVLGLTVLGAILGGTITAPFLAGVLALLYIDRRMRAEGLDFGLRRQLGSATRPTGAPVPGGGP